MNTEEIDYASLNDEDRQNLMIEACIYGDREVLEELIGLGVDINRNYRKDLECFTPFLVACEYGRRDIVIRLFQLGAKFDERDILMARENGHQALAQYLTNIQEKMKEDEDI